MILQSPCSQSSETRQCTEATIASLRFFPVSGDGERGLCIAYTVGQPCFLIVFVRNRKIHVDF